MGTEPRSEPDASELCTISRFFCFPHRTLLWNVATEILYCLSTVHPNATFKVILGKQLWNAFGTGTVIGDAVIAFFKNESLIRCWS